MAGGFDGMGVSTRSTRREPHEAQASVMGVRQKGITHSVDNLYKYLINKNIFVYGSTKLPKSW